MSIFPKRDVTPPSELSTHLPDEVKDLLRLISRPDDPKRQDYLKLACQLSGLTSCAVLVWLHDKGRNGYVLDRAYVPSIGEDPSALLYQFAPIEAVANETTPIHLTDREIALEKHPQIRQWCSEQGFAGHERVFPLRVNENDPEPMGYVLFVSASPIPATKVFLIECVIDAFAGVIARSRAKRLLKASGRMRSAIIDPTQQPIKSTQQPIKPTQQTTDAWLALAAQTLQEATSADCCLVFKRQEDLSFKVMAGAPVGIEKQKLSASRGSLTDLIAEKQITVRLPDFRDDGQRDALFGTKEYDAFLVQQLQDLLKQEFRAWMAAPVLIGQHSGQHAIAVIMVLNKTKHLARQFSDTDQQILEMVCQDLGKAIPGVETFECMKRISNSKLSPDMSQPENRRKVFDLLSSIIPGVASAVLRLNSPDLLEPKMHFLGGDDTWFTNLPTEIRATTSVLPTAWFKGTADGAKRFGFAAKIPGIEGEVGLLLIGLHRHYLSDFERHVLTFLCAELGHLLWAEQSVDKQLHDIYQLHHAIRSSLTGINHLEVVMGCYNIYREHGAVSELQNARFRKALEKTYAANKRTQVLMEESRFLLSGISRDTLRIGGHSITALVREVTRAVTPSAERRGIEIQLDQQKVPSGWNSVDMDHFLIYMLIFNLLENAVKYSFREKEIQVKVSVDNANWVMKVTNQGAHIKPEDKNDIFKPFLRRPTGQAATTRPGTGLGLAVVDKIVKAHGGSITVESNLLGKHPHAPAETSFTVTMPRKIQSKEKL